MRKTIKDFLPEKEAQKLIQARVPVQLHKETARILERLGLSWVDFVEASCRRLLVETDSISPPKKQKVA